MSYSHHHFNPNSYVIACLALPTPSPRLIFWCEQFFVYTNFKFLRHVHKYLQYHHHYLVRQTLCWQLFCFLSLLPSKLYLHAFSNDFPSRFSFILILTANIWIVPTSMLPISAISTTLINILYVFPTDDSNSISFFSF